MALACAFAPAAVRSRRRRRTRDP